MSRYMNPSRMIKLTVSIFLALVFVVCLLLPDSSDSNIGNYKTRMLTDQSNSDRRKLEQVLRKTSTDSRTLIMTMLDKSWASPGSILDLFLESFRIGEGTKRLLNHLVIVALDNQAFQYCKSIHPHCFHLKPTYASVTPFKSMNQKRYEVLEDVIQFGYSVLYTEADVMWLRNPFALIGDRVDLAIGCDSNGTTGGFFYMRADDLSLAFFKAWNLLKVLDPNMHNLSQCETFVDNDVVKMTGLRLMVLETKYYGGFCQPRRDVSEMRAMHGNCCNDLESKVHDLKLFLDHARKSKTHLAKGEGLEKVSSSWRGPEKCLTR